MVRERGSGVTPPRVVALLKKAVEEKSQFAVAKESGLGVAAINRYLSGIGEPTTGTLKKLSIYFKKPISWLQGGSKDGEFEVTEEWYSKNCKKFEGLLNEFNKICDSEKGFALDFLDWFYDEMFFSELQQEELPKTKSYKPPIK